MKKTNSYGKKMLHLLIGFIIMGIFYVLPAPEPITHTGMVVLSIFFVTNYWYVTVDMVASSFLSLACYVLLTGSPAAQVIINAVGNPTIWQMIVMLGLLYGMNQTSATQALTRILLSQKFFYGKSVLTVAYFFVVSTLMCALKVPVLVSLAIGGSVMKAAGVKPSDRLYAPFMVGSFFAASLGMSVIPYGSWIAALLTAFESIAGMPISGAAYIVFGLVLCILLDILMAVLIAFVFRCDLASVGSLNMESLTEGRKDGTLSNQGKFIMFLFFLSLVGSILPSFFPQFFISVFINQRLSINMLFALLFVAACLVPIDGTPALNAGEALSKGMIWPLLCSMATCLYIATAMSSDETGIKTALSGFFGQMFGGMPGVVMLICVVILCVLITGLFSNTATSIVFMSATVPIAASFGLNPIFVGVAIMWASMPGYLTPGGCPNSPYLHGMTEISRKNIYQYMLCYLGAFIVVDVILTLLMTTIFSL